MPKEHINRLRDSLRCMGEWVALENLIVENRRERDTSRMKRHRN